MPEIQKETSICLIINRIERKGQIFWVIQRLSSKYVFCCLLPKKDRQFSEWLKSSFALFLSHRVAGGKPLPGPVCWRSHRMEPFSGPQCIKLLRARPEIVELNYSRQHFSFSPSDLAPFNTHNLTSISYFITERCTWRSTRTTSIARGGNPNL